MYDDEKSSCISLHHHTWVLCKILIAKWLIGIELSCMSEEEGEKLLVIL